MQCLLELSLLFGLLSPVWALMCYDCMDHEDISSCQSLKCTSSNMQCFSGGTFITSEEGKNTSEYHLCVPQRDCTGPVSVNFGAKRISVNSSCCSTDMCNNATLSAEPGTMNPNGLECFGCLGSSHCASETVKCLGSEDRCFKLTSAGQNMTEIYRGCMSSRACEASGFLIFGLELNSSLSCCMGKLCNSARHPGESGLWGFPLLLVLSLLLYC
ncbi:phospholipase A2 inhibitor and Ly6/PLAUR domain-containing protein-like isoform X2 [Amia ocellicauda]|uniref:phospholipase A2 inhibitor and Ly6/PLAUR domain-containing protein-like isoform X2 n=1 Tax=Amia ocellicauda TaxID=2972642 RepID=UPI003463E791